MDNYSLALRPEMLKDSILSNDDVTNTIIRRTTRRLSKENHEIDIDA